MIINNTTKDDTNKISNLMTNEDDDDDEEADLQAAIALSLAGQQQEERTLDADVLDHTSNNGGGSCQSTVLTRPMTREEFQDLQQIMWNPALTTENDQDRWKNQAIHTSTTSQQATRDGSDLQHQTSTGTSSSTTGSVLDQLVKSPSMWGLVQQHGGPCGVLAAIQAEMIRYFFKLYDSVVLAPSHVHDAIHHAMACVLARAATTPPAFEDTATCSRTSVKIVVPTSTAYQTNDSGSPLDIWTNESFWQIQTISLDKNAMEEDDEEGKFKTSKRQKTDAQPRNDTQQLLEDAVVPHVKMCLNVLQFVYSIVLTRGVSTVRAEFDDFNNTQLTGQFGHCTQELMNLLLTGQAVSNVMDGVVKMSEDLICRGITGRPAVGYLSQLEALRFCEVGDYYKSPKHPIWVIGSTSHFTVLFGDQAALQESKSDRLLEDCRRAFKAVEGGQENGFIAVQDLSRAIQSLNIDLTDSQMQGLGATLQVSGAGIILWDDFWKATSRLLMGATLESVLQEKQSGVLGTPATAVASSSYSVSQPVKQQSQIDRMETDEEMARRLAAEWDSEDNKSNEGLYGGMSALAVAAQTVSEEDFARSGTNMTDEEYARLLQAEWNAEISSSGNNSVDAVNGSPMDLNTEPDETGIEEMEDAKPAAKEPNHLDFERFGDTFSLHHYNGLRGGLLTSLRITRLGPEEAVGASIALTREGHSGGSADLEDVIRTKWPSCMINWLGKQPPYID